MNTGSGPSIPLFFPHFSTWPLHSSIPTPYHSLMYLSIRLKPTSHVAGVIALNTLFIWDFPCLLSLDISARESRAVLSNSCRMCGESSAYQSGQSLSHLTCHLFPVPHHVTSVTVFLFLLSSPYSTLSRPLICRRTSAAASRKADLSTRQYDNSHPLRSLVIFRDLPFYPF
jgi:hypothetical protein